MIPESPGDVLPTPISPQSFSALVDAVRQWTGPPATPEQAIMVQPEIAANYEAFVDHIQHLQTILDTDETGEALKSFLGAGHAVRPRGGDVPSVASAEQVMPPHATTLAIALGILLKVGKQLERTRERGRHTSMLNGEDVSETNYLTPQEEGTAIASLLAAGPVLRQHMMMQAGHPDAEGLPVPLLVDVVDALQKISTALTPTAPRGRRRRGADSDVRRTAMSYFSARHAGLLARRGFLTLDALPDALQSGYDRAWHTHAAYRSPVGNFTSALRRRAAVEGDPALLTVLAASSDGRNRGVAGIAAKTPPPVYDQLIYDNAMAVLLKVVQSRQFTQPHAYAMLQTDLANQITAVMLKGRIHMSIRVLAAQKAIGHQGVSPVHVYNFLEGRVRDPRVPHALWRDFVLETRRRLSLVRVHGQPADIGEFEHWLQQIASSFTVHLLRPYWRAHQEVSQSEEGHGVSGGPQPPSTAARRAILPSTVRARPSTADPLAKQRAFLQAADFIRDPDVLDVLLEGATDPTHVQQMLRYCVEADIPVTKRLLIKVFLNEDKGVRETGRGLMPQVRPEDVDRMQEEVQQCVEEDYAAVRDQVFTRYVPPDYAGIDGTARHLSRMRHYFRAARELGDDELVTIYVDCAKRDPRRIPAEFRHATKMRRYQSHAIDASVQDATKIGVAPEEEDVFTAAFFRRPIVQAELFANRGDIAPDASHQSLYRTR